MDLSFLMIGSKYTRPELAQRWGYESHHAISRGVVAPQGEKVLLLFVTRIKQEVLTQYQDHLSGDLLFWEGQEKHGTDDRIRGAAKAGDELHLFYREVHHTPFEYRGEVRLLNAVRCLGVAPSRRRRAGGSSGARVGGGEAFPWESRPGTASSTILGQGAMIAYRSDNEPNTIQPTAREPGQSSAAWRTSFRGLGSIHERTRHPRQGPPATGPGGANRLPR
jgi:hypothetical protein